MTDKLVASAARQINISGANEQSRLYSPVITSNRPSISYASSATVQPIATTTTTASETRKNPFDIRTLMSPPEPTPLDSFSHGLRPAQPASTMLAPAISDSRKVPLPPPSPPISPYTKAASANAHEQVQSPNSTNNADPILYPSVETASSPPTLFVDEDSIPSEINVASPHSAASPSTSTIDVAATPVPDSFETARVVDGHIAARPNTLFGGAVSPPKREDYELALFFKSNVMKFFQESPRSWLRQERELLRAERADRRSSTIHARPLLPAKATPRAPNDPTVRVRGPARVTKPTWRGGPREISSEATNTARNTSGSIRVSTPSHPTIKRVSLTPEPRVRTVAPNREDKDFNSLPDFCPPLTSLPNKPHCLKVEWKGNALDLSNDPNRHFLHLEEVALAASLRLDCATYLTSKRRVFVRRLECARIGKEFRKTDAQQACKIDVNKASKLWTAYDKVGWLGSEWMKRHM